MGRQGCKCWLVIRPCSTESKQDGPSFAIYDDALIYHSDQETPQLISEMSNEQYLDAISCPRDDPATQGKKVMQSSADMDDPTDLEDNASVMDDGTTDKNDGSESDASEGGRIYETLPKGAIQPNSKTEKDVEKVCRLICSTPPKASAELEARVLESQAGSRYRFLHPSDEYHAYYRWRLERNIAGKGIDAKYDYGLGPGQGRELRLEA